jgi:hypothetical protein
VLEQAREVAEQIRHEVEQERAAVVEETDQVRAFRDGLLDDLGRVHGEISGLLERTRMQRDQALGAGGAADPKATQNGNAKKPTEPTRSPRTTSGPPSTSQSEARHSLRWTRPVVPASSIGAASRAVGRRVPAGPQEAQRRGSRPVKLGRQRREL